MTTKRGGPPIGSSNAAKTRLLEAALRREITQDPERIRKIALAVLELAEDKNLQAIALLRDTVDGKPRQRIEVSEVDNDLDLAPTDELIAAVDRRMAPFRQAAILSMAADGGVGERGHKTTH